MVKKELEVIKPEKVTKSKNNNIQVGKKTKTTGQKVLGVITLIMAVITGRNYVIIDSVPFIDEALLTLITAILVAIQIYLKNKCGEIV